MTYMVVPTIIDSEPKRQVRTPYGRLTAAFAMFTEFIVTPPPAYAAEQRLQAEPLF